MRSSMIYYNNNHRHHLFVTHNTDTSVNSIQQYGSK